MAGYPKIWTSILEETWWKKWGGLTRGCFLQLILLMKNGDENGVYVAHSWTKLSSDLSVDRRTARDQCTIMSRDSGLEVYKNAQGQLILHHPKYLFYQGLNAKTHAEYIKTRRSGLYKNVPLPDQTRPNQSRVASNVDNSREENPEEKSRVISESLGDLSYAKDPLLYNRLLIFLADNEARIETEAMGIAAQENYHGDLAELIASVKGDLESQVKTTPEKFTTTNFLSLMRGYLRTQAKTGKPGDGGMTTPLSAAKERTDEDEKRLRAGTRGFKNGSGVKI